MIAPWFPEQDQYENLRAFLLDWALRPFARLSSYALTKRFGIGGNGKILEKQGEKNILLIHPLQGNAD